jgi:DNA-directed RNA polymerase sigma subunit (sigma70/sigma32)
VPLLEDVAKAAARERQLEEKRLEAREQFIERIRLARDEGISFAKIARAAGLSKERVRQLYEGE